MDSPGRELRVLEALFSETEFSKNEHDVKSLPINFIIPSKNQPRRIFNELALQELADSIKTQGIIQPIVVRFIDGDLYEIIAGERRWRAAQIASLEEVPVVIRNDNDEQAMITALIENIQREDLNPVEEAVAFHKLVNECNLIHEEVGKIVGKSRTSITNLIRLLTLENEVKQMLISNEIEQGHGKVLLTLEGKEQISAAKKIAEKNLSVRQAEVLVREYKNPKSDKIDFDDKLFISSYKDKISAIPFASKLLRKKKGGYQVVYDFKSQSEVEEHFNSYRKVNKDN